MKKSEDQWMTGKKNNKHDTEWIEYDGKAQIKSEKTNHYFGTVKFSQI